MPVFVGNANSSREFVREMYICIYPYVYDVHQRFTRDRYSWTRIYCELHARLMTRTRNESHRIGRQDVGWWRTQHELSVVRYWAEGCHCHLLPRVEFRIPRRANGSIVAIIPNVFKLRDDHCASGPRPFVRAERRIKTNIKAISLYFRRIPNCRVLNRRASKTHSRSFARS